MGGKTRKRWRICRARVVVSPQTHVAVEVPVPGEGFGVPQPDGVVGGAGEEGRWRQTGPRGVRQLRIHLRRRVEWSE